MPKFKKRLRKSVYPKRIEIFNVHEYGKNGKKHWHLIVFNHDFDDKTVHTTKGGIPLYTSKILTKLWPYGFNTTGDVSAASAMYQAQYCEKDFKHSHVGTAKKSHSKHSGIAKPYFLKHFKQLLSLGYVPIDGKKMPLPRYFEKLAHKHWAHYYQKDLFFQTQARKAVYKPFKQGQENKEIADLWIQYKSLKQEKINALEEEWENVISQYLTTNSDPDFILTTQNALHDLKNKSQQERF